MELFPSQPDLSLQISLPNSNSNSKADESMDLSFWMRSNSGNTTTTTATDLSLSSLTSMDLNKYQRLKQHQQYTGVFHMDSSSTVRPIKGIPVYHYPPCFSFLNRSQSTSRLFSRIPPKRSTRAPRMKWTTSLHARFVHAVELLGGHERATPKSVLELMDVKDLTLAHVKSHLQMYRTVKSTDKPPASSVLFDGFENGSAGEISDDSLPDNGSSSCWERTSTKYDSDYSGLWINSSSGGVRLNGTTKDHVMEKISSCEKKMDEAKVLERSCDVNSSCTDINSMKPNLEFTLGI